MGSASDKAKGLVNEGVGKAKQAAGKMTDNPKLHGEGIAQERKGEAQQYVGKAKDIVKDAVDKM
ncbi:MAG: CsbD family protein [Micavibrio aeruginosavorus]|uniref:CsbD family protein n=1 Tax=Micavibrio aeruginosavorus TaxID=349221 RepID=A0A2W5PX66_9BACT|nr:MAG: CsbD family protein [Micavibrio aeruginosavorus]